MTPPMVYKPEYMMNLVFIQSFPILVNPGVSTTLIGRGQVHQAALGFSAEPPQAAHAVNQHRVREMLRLLPGGLAGNGGIAVAAAGNVGAGGSCEGLLIGNRGAVFA